MKDKNHTKEAKRKIGESSRGRKMSDEAKYKIGKASKERWRKKHLKNNKES